MNYRLLASINAVLLALFGLLFLAVPDLALGFFGTETYAATVFVSRFFGAAMILAGVFIWMAKSLTDASAEKFMTIMLLLGSIVGFVLILMGMVGSDVVRSNGWIPLVLHILFAVGYGYLVSGVKITASKK